MSDFTPPNGMPKDINNGLGAVKGLDHDDPNDTAFKLVTLWGQLYVTLLKSYIS